MKKQIGTSRRNFLVKSSAAVASFTIVPRFVLGGNGFTAPSDKINLGFIGTGKQSKGLGSRFIGLDDIQMVAACDVDTAKLSKFKEIVDNLYAEKSNSSKYEGCDIYTDYMDVINREDVDGVIICLPDHWHAIPSIAAMKAGKDVYCEKPMAHTVEEGRAMVEAARKYDRVFQTGSMQRSWEQFRQACELVRNGYLGEITEVKVNVGDPAKACDLPNQEIPDEIRWDRWIGPAQYRGYNDLLSPPWPIKIWPKWRDYKEFGGGILSDWGAHMFDIAQWGLGMDETVPVEYIPPSDKSATRGLVMNYANGIKMVHEDFGRGWAVRFIGSEGTLDVSRSFMEPSNKKLAKKEMGSGDVRLYKSDNHYQDWIDAIKNRSMPICDVETGHRSASVCNIANIAYELGRPLKFDPISETFYGDLEANKLRGKEYRKPYVLDV
ncbi:MAG: Gfo/Idh/MocA family oxidoreductase [Cyclobacteriaceae bacterium]